MKISETRKIPRMDLTLSALGLGTAAFGGLYQPVSGEDALAAIKQAEIMGIRYFDTAPMYGLGRAEHLLGHALREQLPDDTKFAVSTKVGRLMARSRPGRELPPAPPKNPFDSGWNSGLNFEEVFDYSYDGIMRSFDDSQQRLGRPEIDLLYVHDIGRLTHADRHQYHWDALTSGGFRALEELRAAGLIRGFGLGVNEVQAMDDAMNEADLDCCLLAGRYTLLDRSADALLNKAQKNEVGIVIGGVFNSGILASEDGDGTNKFDYMDAPAEIITKVKKLAEICRRYQVPLGAAALQFPMRHSAVVSVLIGPRNADQVQTNADWFEYDIPAELWQEIEALE